MNTKLKNAALIFATAACTFIGTFSLRAFAVLDGNAATSDVPQVVPYQGNLDLDGAPYSGLMDMRFSLYEDAQGGDPAWSEEWTTAEDRPIQVFGGRFGVNLGSVSSITSVIADGGTLYLGIEVRTPPADADVDPGEWVALSGRQRLNPVPYAMWTARSSDLAVGGNLTVAGSAQFANGATVTSGGLRVSAGGANITGDVSVAGATTLTGNTRVNGNATVTGTSYTGSHHTVNGNVIVNGTDLALGAGQATPGGRALVNRPNDTLFINYENDFTGGTYFQGGVQMTSSLGVTGNSTFTGAATFNGASAVNNTLTVTGGLSNPNGDVTINDFLDITGDIQDLDSDVVLINDGLTTTGNFTAQQDVSMGDCRICLLYGDVCNTDTDSCTSDRSFTCVQLIPGRVSGLFKLSDGGINSDDGFRLAFLCDGGGNADGTAYGNNAGDWPGVDGF